MLKAAWRCGLICGIAWLLTAADVAHAQSAPAKAHGSRSTVDDQEARDLFRLGKQAFDEARFERALKYFKDAYDLSGRPGLLSNIGTALDRLRRDQEALDAYRQYLAEVPDAPNREVIEERVRVIEAAMNKSLAPVATPAAPPPSAAEPTAPSPAVTAAQAAAGPTSSAPTAAVASDAPAKDSSSGGITSRWWFWTGLGVIAAGAVVVGVAAASGGGSSGVESPAVLSSATRVREL